MRHTMVKEIRSFDDFCKLVKELNMKMDMAVVMLEDGQSVEVMPHKVKKAGELRFKTISEKDHVEAVRTMDKIQARLDETEPYCETVEDAMEYARRRGYAAH
jgi:hypothetical protein